MTFTYQQSRHADEDASEKKAGDGDLWRRAKLRVRTETCLING